jgi:hypothetical protein
MQVAMADEDGVSAVLVAFRGGEWVLEAMYD